MILSNRGGRHTDRPFLYRELFAVSFAEHPLHIGAVHASPILFYKVNVVSNLLYCNHRRIITQLVGYVKGYLPLNFLDPCSVYWGPQRALTRTQLRVEV